jgi:hypothetical protein
MNTQASQAFANNALTSYIPSMSSTAEMNNDSRKCMMEVIQIVSAHTADVLVHVMKIISEKYGHSMPEMMETVRTHPAFHAIQMHPILTTDFFTVPPTSHITPVVAAPVAVTPVAVAVAPVPVPVAVKKVTRVVRKKPMDVVEPTAAQSAVELPPQATPAPVIDVNISPKSMPSPVSPLSQVVVIDTPPASTVIDIAPPVQIKKQHVIVKRKEGPVIEADKKEVKPHTY